MTALAAARLTKSRNKLPQVRRYKMKASTTIYEGGLVMLDSTGLAVPAAASAGNLGVVGVAIETLTSDGSNALFVRVEEGEFLLNATSIAQVSVGATMFAADDNTVDETQGTNQPKSGQLVEVISATSGWVRVERPFCI